MKRILIPLLFSLLLVSCSNAVPATATSIPPTVTSTATPLPTHTPSPTLEPWMVSLPEGVVSIQMGDSEIFGLDAQGKQISKFDLEKNEWVKIVVDVKWDIDRAAVDANAINISGELNGVDTNFILSFDPAESRLSRLRLNPSFVDNETGYNAEQAWMNWTQNFYYLPWKSTNPSVVSGKITDTSFENYIRIVANLQAGVGDVEDGRIYGFANDMIDDGYKTSRTLFSPFVESGENPILTTEVVLVNGSRAENYRKFPNEMNSGVGFNYDPNTKTMTIYLATLRARPEIRPDLLAGDMSALSGMFMSNSESGSYSENGIDQISDGKYSEDFSLMLDK